MKYVAMTCMDRPYYDKCGELMIKTFEKYWSNAMPLHVYTEGNDFSVEGNNIVDAGWELGADYETFQNTHPNKKVKRFAKKGFSVIHAMENIDCDRLIWIDADTVIKKPIDKSLLKDISKKTTLSTHYSVWHIVDEIKYHSCETGFFILNKNHKGYKEFCNLYKNIYVSQDQGNMRRFYDGEIYGKTVETLQNRYEMNNLNPAEYKTPIPKSILEPYISHHKANLKNVVDYTAIEGSLL